MNDKTTEGGRPPRPWKRSGLALALALALALGLLLAGGLGWIGLREAAVPAATPASPPAAPASAPPPAAMPAPAASASVSPGVRPAASAATPAAPDHAGLSPERLADIDKQWCTHGHEAHLQAQQVLNQTYPITIQSNKLDRDILKARVDAASREPGTQALRARQTQLKARWVGLLRQRGDLRSQALADYLTTTLTAGAEAAAAQRQLLNRAQGSQDPVVFMVWQMARTYCFEQSFCSALPLSEWRKLEPLNLLAWMPERIGAGPAALDWAALQRTTSANSHLQEVQALLLPLLDQESPGLTLQAGLGLVQQFSGLWPVMHGSLPLASACIAMPDPTGGTRDAACRHAAELLWRSPSSGLFEAQFALTMAAAAGQEEQAPWAARSAFVKGLSAADEQALKNLEFRSRWDEQGCEAQPRQRQTLKDLALSGFWAAGVGEARWRGVP